VKNIEKFTQGPVARAVRMKSIYNELYGHFPFVEPVPATEENLRLVHT